MIMYYIQLSAGTQLEQDSNCVPVKVHMHARCPYWQVIAVCSPLNQLKWFEYIQKQDFYCSVRMLCV